MADSFDMPVSLRVIHSQTRGTCPDEPMVLIIVGPGFEPRYSLPESEVLPLDDPTLIVNYIKISLYHID